MICIVYYLFVRLLRKHLVEDTVLFRNRTFLHLKKRWRCFYTYIYIRINNILNHFTHSVENLNLLSYAVGLPHTASPFMVMLLLPNHVGGQMFVQVHAQEMPYKSTVVNELIPLNRSVGR